jgi:hypothetical protein
MMATKTQDVTTGLVFLIYLALIGSLIAFCTEVCSLDQCIADIPYHVTTDAGDGT